MHITSSKLQKEVPSISIAAYDSVENSQLQLQHYNMSSIDFRCRRKYIFAFNNNINWTEILNKLYTFLVLNIYV